MLKIVLQPFVENAFKHGIDIRSEPGWGTVVRIRIKRLTRTN